MNTDALLAILLNVVIPSVLAVAGGILAVKALSNDKRVERARWITLFVGLAIAAIVLAFIQQVRLTTQQAIVDQKAAANELRASNDNRYIQGRLDSIVQVMVTFSQQGSPDKVITPFIRALEGVLATMSAQAPNPRKSRTLSHHLPTSRHHYCPQLKREVEGLTGAFFQLDTLTTDDSGRLSRETFSPSGGSEWQQSRDR